jgi:hypothetical protein
MRIHALIVLALVACEKPKESTTTATSASAVIPAVTSAPTASASVAASVAPTSDEPVNTKEVTVSIKDVDKDGTSKSVKASLGGTVTLFLPDANGATWSVDQVDKSLGKAKEETMPGFGPGINAHQFQWAMKGPLLKAGETHKVTFTNKKAGKTFTLTIELIS